MKILHYSLGFPPYRSGGLTKFSMDLMREQIREVFGLQGTPVRITIRQKGDKEE